jgi:hypothetical protein
VKKNLTPLTHSTNRNYFKDFSVKLFTYKILVGKQERKRPLGRPRRRWVKNIKIDLREIGWDGIDWIDLGQDNGPVEGSCEHGDEPSGSLKCWEVPMWLHNWQLLRKGSAP